MLNRFDTWSRGSARALLLAVVMLIGVGFIAKPAVVPPRPTGADSTSSDQALFQRVVERITAGDDYYGAIAEEHRLRRYPLFPFVAVRPPALAYAFKAAGTEARAALVLDVLAVAATIALCLWAFVTSGSPLVVAAVAIASAIAVSTAANSPLFHESWAALLIMLSLTLRTDRRFVVSVVCGLLAVLVRELAVPFVLVMLAMALYERQRREAIAWALAIVASGVVLGIHAQQVDAVRVASDLRSPGWVDAGGWPFILRIVHTGTSLMLLPQRAGALLIPCAWIGWLGLRNQLAGRVSLYLGGMITAFMVIGRPDNEYWGILLGPLLPIGLLFAPVALLSLWRAAWRAEPVSQE